MTTQAAPDDRGSDEPKPLRPLQRGHLLQVAATVRELEAALQLAVTEQNRTVELILDGLGCPADWEVLADGSAAVPPKEK